MKNLNDAFHSGTMEQQTRRRNGMIVISVTLVLLIIAFLVLAIGSLVIALSGDKEPDPDTPVDPADLGYTTTTLDASTKLKAGDLLLLDEDHPYAGSTPSVVKFNGHETRPKTADGKNIYTLSNSTSYAATEETVIAFHAMVKAYYEQSEDDDLIVDKAYNVDAGNQADEVYMAGTAIALKYYVNYTEEPDKIESIWDVEDYEWIYDHAYEYGFVQVSKAEGEEHIFRYVGQPHATYMKKNNKTLSEYLTLLQGYTYTDPLKVTATNAVDGETDKKSVSYSVYYLTAEETAYVPEHGKYTVSGDNLGGYIITVNNTAAKNK